MSTNGNVKFLTHEVGSLAKPVWLVKTSAGKPLEESDVDVDHVNRLGWTALLEAILLSDGGPRHQEIVRLLIEHGADVDLADGDSVRPLAHARAAAPATTGVDGRHPVIGTARARAARGRAVAGGDRPIA